MDPDPITSTRLFVHTIREVYGNMGLVTIGTRNAPPGHYELTRLIHQAGVRGGEYADLEFVPPDAPIHSGGFLGHVINMNRPGFLETASIENDPVLGDQLRPYRAYIVLPVITQGDIVGYVVQFSTDPAAFTADILLTRFLTVSFLGSLAHAKRVAMELDRANALNVRLEEQRAYLTDEISLEHNFDDIVFESAAFKSVLRKVEQVAQTDATVLILGESGTGKELLAHAVHRISRREPMPLIRVNCAALPANLIESELFGHEKGAFTGALSAKTGRFELADGGTIFLDEIGVLPLELQVKLLRVLQEGEFEKLGEGKTRTVNVRVVAATNRDLEQEVQEGRFREDLFYRLNVFPLDTPPLRERKEDIPALAQHFLLKYNAAIGRDIESISDSAMRQLQGYDWPGNVRELQNLIERAVILSEGKMLDLSQAFSPARDVMEESAAPQTLEENEFQFIRNTLEACGWRIQGPQGAAARLAVSPSTLRSRMKRLGIVRP